ncbi:hypothetical protein PPYR_01225 [Photinus pyralis]|uniref:Signal transducing adapter molecule 1 n=2 Tax=Photinus pyralis TaxID=7054 RepID=A0A1Y1K3B2_PHOPY|nr:signal transducing adapter molecule 1 [Photinus pyralis]KAB0804255.1 hypothetical protein PPYR_01225 [Photinus pyralis]
MGLFSAASPFDSDVEKATSENNTSEQWGLILDVCDRASKTSEDSRNCLRSIIRRLNNVDPHIAVQAATLLDACVSNCGKTFHIEIASREFENEYVKLIKKAHPKVQQKLKESLKKWAEGEFKSDPQLNLIPSLLFKLKSSGIDFTVETPAKKTMTLSKDPNVVQTQDEEDQIAKAIELSLKETSGSPRSSSLGGTSLYPTNLNLASSVIATTPVKEPRKVRALYDFEAAEDNELTFTAGEIIVVSDDSDTNWWKGSNHRGEGLFPANFVTADLSAEPEQLLSDKLKKVQFKESAAEVLEDKEPEDVEINEEKIDRLLHLLHEADPTNPSQDSDEMLKLEREVNGMGPLIDAELETVDRKHAQLTKLSSDLVEALSLYHMLMREPQMPPVNKMHYDYQPTGAHPSVIYNGAMPINRGPPQYMPPYAMPPNAQPIHMPPPPGMLPQQQQIPPGMIQSRMNFPPQQPQLSYGPHSMPSGYAPAPPQSTQLPHQAPQSGVYPTSSNSHIM